MVVMMPKSESKSVMLLHNYLYEKMGNGEDVTEVADLYEYVDAEVHELEESLADAWEEDAKLYKDLVSGVKAMKKDFRRLNRAELEEALEDMINEWC